MRRRPAAPVVLLLAALWLVSAAAPAEAGNFLWRVTSKNGGEAYLFGSVHLAHAGIYPLRDPITEAFERSGSLAVEIDIDGLPPGVLNGYLLAHGFSPDPRPLLERLTPATREALDESGFYRPEMAPLQPWLAALNIQLTVMREHGFEPEYGLDKFFIAQAKGRGVPVLDLETLDDQLKPLAEMSGAESDLFLRSVVLEMDELPATLRTFLDTWNSGDVQGFGEVFFREYDRYPELVPLLDKIIIRRNHRLTARINSLLDRRPPVFIVVGAGHLVGEQGILALLTARGHTVTQM